MKNKISAKFVKCFLFLLTASLIIFEPLNSRAQSSTVDLAGTEWTMGPFNTIPDVANVLTMTISRTVAFYSQNKAEAMVVKNYGGGFEWRQVTEYQWDYSRGVNEPRTVMKQVPISPQVVPQPYQGTYRTAGKLVYLDFPQFTISASVDGNMLKGILTNKSTNQTEDWSLSLTGGSPSYSSATSTASNVSPKPNRISPSGNSSSVKNSISTDEARKKRIEELFDKANEYAQQGNHRKAIGNYTMVLSLNTDFARKVITYANRGNSKVEIQDYRGAVNDYDEAIRLALTELALPRKVYQSDDPVGEASAAMTSASGEDSRKEFVKLLLNLIYNFRGIAKNKLGTKVSACQDFREACKFGNEDACKSVKANCK